MWYEKLSPLTNQAASLEPVTLVSVERTPGADGNTFTLTFTKNVQEPYYILSYDENKMGDFSSQGRNKIMSEEEEGKREEG